MELVITDKNGWIKREKVDKAITRIGRGVENDIQLRSDGIGAIHLQFLYSTDSPTNCKLVNLADEVMIYSNQSEYGLPMHESIDLSEGDRVRLGDFDIEIKLPFVANYIQSSSSINATLTFSDTVLRPGKTLQGYLTITNLGEDCECQFLVSSGGLPEDCIQIFPIPIIFPGAQEDVRINLHHHQHYPGAGDHELLLSIIAPDSYPGEEVRIKQQIQVLPVYKQSIALIDDVVDPLLQGNDQPQEIPKVTADDSQVLEINQEEDVLNSILDEETKSDVLGNQVVIEPQTSQQNQNRSTIKVIKNEFDSFWEDES